MVKEVSRYAILHNSSNPGVPVKSADISKLLVKVRGNGTKLPPNLAQAVTRVA